MVGAAWGIVSAFFSGVASFIKLLVTRQQQQITATDESRGAIAQAAKDNETSSRVSSAEGQAVTDTPSDNEGLAQIADKGKW